MPLPAEWAAYKARIDALDETQIAWFAGWLCADGSIGIADSRGRPTLDFTICDRDPLEKMSELFGNSVGGPFAPSGLGTKPRLKWKISGWKACIILERVLPWLSLRYAERARRGLEFKVRTDCGLKLSVADIASIKAALATGGRGIGKSLAFQYGVTDGLISAIKLGRVWDDFE